MYEFMKSLSKLVSLVSIQVGGYHTSVVLLRKIWFIFFHIDAKYTWTLHLLPLNYTFTVSAPPSRYQVYCLTNCRVRPPGWDINVLTSKFCSQAAHPLTVLSNKLNFLLIWPSVKKIFSEDLSWNSSDWR